MCVTRRSLLRGLNIYSGPPSLAGPLSFISSCSVLNSPSRLLLLNQSRTATKYRQQQPRYNRSSRPDLRPRQKDHPSHRFSCQRALVACSTAFVEHRLLSHISSQDDSRTSSSCQPSALDSALRLFHTRGHQRCFRSLSLTATYQGSQDPHRSKG